VNTKVSQPVSKIMTKNVITLDINQDLLDACRLFLRNKIRHLPVVKGRKMVGILSYNDILRISFGEVYDDKSFIDQTVYKMLTIEQIMAKNPVKIKPYYSVHRVAKILMKNKFHALPVTQNHHLVGMVSTTDLLRYLIT